MSSELWKEFMQEGSITLFWDNSIYEESMEAIKIERFEIYSFDCNESDNNNFHKEIVQTLHFQDYYGENLDAFDDKLSISKDQNILDN